MIQVTTHAADRYIERVDPSLSYERAREALLAFAPIVRRAAEFGCSTVRIGCGAKLVLEGETIVTVLPKGWASRSLLTPIDQSNISQETK